MTNKTKGEDLEKTIKISNLLVQVTCSSQAKALGLLMQLIANAENEPKTIVGIELKKGDLLTTLKELSFPTGLTVSEIRTCLRKLTELGLIEKQTTNRYTIISVKNFETYFAPKKKTTELMTREVEYIDKFNEFMCSHLPKVEKMTQTRLNAMKRRIEDKTFSTMESWEDYLNKVAQSDFLTGKATKWKTNFEWLIRPSNIQKVLDGNYDNKNRITDDIREGFEALYGTR